MFKLKLEYLYHIYIDAIYVLTGRKDAVSNEVYYIVFGARKIVP